MARTDYLCDEDNDLQIANGDFVKGNSDAQHIQDIIEAAPNSYKEFPTLGVNIKSQENGIIDQSFMSKMQKQLAADGYDINDIDFVVNG